MSTLPARLEMVPFDGPIDATVRPPGSKSLTNRALLVAALARGRSTLRGVLFADDTEAMLECIEALGASVTIDGTTVTIEGTGGSIREASARLYADQSGTTARFVAATLLLGSAPIVLDADPAMRRRPMGPTLDALRSLGATVRDLGEPGCLPVEVTGPVADPASVPSITISASASSQFASGLLLVGACMPRGLRLELEGAVVSRPYLDMTVAVMEAFGATVRRPDDATWIVEATGYDATDHVIEPDASGASYFFAAAAIVGGRVTVEGLGRQSLQGDLAFVDVLERMGAGVDRGDVSTTVRGGPLRGIEIDMADISDTAQTLAAVAAFAEGPTRVTGIGFIRAKETDRVGAVVTEMQRLGVVATEEPDGFVIAPGPISAGVVDTYDDHRMAMSFALLGLRVPGIVIDDPACVTKTFPTYFETLESMRPGGTR